MAMLAEPRRRKRYNLCPRGKALYEDDTRFGTKMLEKMGWSKGKGLGAKEDGEQEFVRIRFKNDAEGLGFEARDDHWTAHEEGFSGLLKSLNGVESDNDDASDVESRPMGFGFKTDAVEQPAKKSQLKEKISGVSLEEKSKQSKARVHYRKFTRGKDLAQYSEKDLANIFGKKVTETDSFTAPLIVSTEKASETEEKEMDPNFAGVHTLSTGLSVTDYFKQKMEAIKNKHKNNDIVNDSEIPLETAQNDFTEPAKKTKKKKDKQLEQMVKEDDEALETATSTVDTEKRKKKKRKAKELKEELPENEAPETETMNEEPAKKKKKKNGKQDVLMKIDISDDGEINRDNEKTKKKKKDKQIAMLPETTHSENILEPERKKKKKDKKERKMLRHELSTVETDVVELKTESVETETQLKKNKKSKHNNNEKHIEQSVLSSSNLTTLNVKTNGKLPSIEPMLTNGEETSEPQCKKKKNKRNNNEPVVKIEPEDASIAPSTEPRTKIPSKNDLELPAPKSDVNVKAANEQVLSVDELIKMRDSYDIYTISSFCAEKFHMLNMKAFKESTLPNISGYGISDAIKLNIVEASGDAQRIVDFWNGVVNKYRQPKLKHAKFIKRTTMNSIKRRKAFSGL